MAPSESFPHFLSKFHYEGVAEGLPDIIHDTISVTEASHPVNPWPPIRSAPGTGPILLIATTGVVPSCFIGHSLSESHI